MSSKPVISVIIPVAGKWDLTRNCLQSLHQYSQEHDIEVIVADNASADETPSVLPDFGSSLFGGRFIYIRNETNRNFGPASNQGAQAASARLLLFLNNDTLLTPNWLPPLLTALNDEPALGAVGPLLLYANETVQHLGVTYSSGGVKHLYKGYPRNHPLVGKSRYMQILTGAALLMPRRIFWEAGGFYEEYVNGMEDIDLCLQIGKNGHKMRCVPESVIYHLESQTPGRHTHSSINERIAKNRIFPIIRPDTHIHALNDKMNPVLNDALGVDILVENKAALELIKKSKNLNISELQELVYANPGWVEGAAMLCSLAEKNGLLEIAMHAAIHEIESYHSLAGTENITRLAKKINNIPSSSLGELAHLEQLYIGPKPRILSRFNYAKELYRHWEDTYMLSLLEAKYDFINKTIARMNGRNL